jgi:BON domain
MEGDQFMRRYQKWLSVGLLALTPGIALAGPLSGLSKKASSPTGPEGRQAVNANQETAEKIKQALLKAKLAGYDIQIDYANGVATLSGMVSTPDQKQAAAKAAQSVSGVKRVDNRMSVAEPPAARRPIQQAAARSARPQGGVRPANYQAAYEGQAPAQVPAEGAMQPEAMRPMGPAPTPMYGAPTGGASHVMYNQPNQPNYAWPSYAQYPNYAAVSYPTQYSASAWPYIGPFYPYPQVPLGWRKATLEWDDGYWNLSFSPRTDRWWWFLDPKNW